MTGVGTDAPRDLRDFVVDTRKRIVALERRQGGGGGGSTPPPTPTPVVPAGFVMAYAGVALPTGWILCDGQTVSRTTYAILFAAIGTTYGTGDGSTTFHVPNYRGRTLVGIDPLQTEFDTLGETGGEKAHLLTIAEMPSHFHTQRFHTSTFAQTAASGLGGMTGGAAADQAAGQNTNPTGGGGAHNNLQPYAVVKYMIATGIAPTP